MPLHLSFPFPTPVKLSDSVSTTWGSCVCLVVCLGSCSNQVQSVLSAIIPDISIRALKFAKCLNCTSCLILIAVL